MTAKQRRAAERAAFADHVYAASEPNPLRLFTRDEIYDAKTNAALDRWIEDGNENGYEIEG